MSDSVDVPISDAVEILVRTTQLAGYKDRAAAEDLVQAAKWLSEREIDGVTQLIVYLLLTNGMSDDARAHKHDPEMGTHIICPRNAALLTLSVFEKRGKPKDYKASFRGPAAPLLMAPFLVKAPQLGSAFLKNRMGRAIRLNYYDQSLLFCDRGFEFDPESSDSLTSFHMIDHKASSPTLVEFLDPRTLPADIKAKKPTPLKTLSLPKKRLTEAGVLNLN